MTVKQAALEVLRRAGRPLTVEEILEVIERDGLFPFRTAGSRRGVVLAALKRHAENAHACTPAKTKVFRQEPDGRFSRLP